MWLCVTESTFSLPCPLCSAGVSGAVTGVWESPHSSWAGRFSALSTGSGWDAPGTKSAAEFLVYSWEPRKGRVMLVLPYNGAGELAPGGGGCSGLTYISEKFWVESHAQFLLIGRHHYQTASLFLALPNSSKTVSENMDELIYGTAINTSGTVWSLSND